MTPALVLFVSTHNVFRSPIAAALFQACLPPAARQRWHAASAGLDATTGAPLSERALESCATRGLQLDGHRARELERDEARAATWVVCMTQAERRLILARYPELVGRVALLGELAGRPENVPSPVNGSLTAHADCVAQIEELVTRAAERLLKLEVPLENGSVTNELWQLGPVHFRRELVSPSLPGRLWRVSRPRVSATDYEPVSEPIIKAWVRRVVDEVLPGEARGVIDYVCLLDGEELALFYGAQDASAYGALLSSHARGRAVFDVHHFPMQDGAPEPPSQVTAAAERTRALLASGASVVLGCAAAAVRTGAVLGELGEATSCVAEAVLHQR